MKTIFIHFRENFGKLWKCVPFLLSTHNSTFLVTGPSKEPLIKPKKVYGRGVNYNIKNYADLDLLIQIFPLCVVQFVHTYNKHKVKVAKIIFVHS